MRIIYPETWSIADWLKQAGQHESGSSEQQMCDEIAALLGSADDCKREAGKIITRYVRIQKRRGN